MKLTHAMHHFAALIALAIAAGAPAVAADLTPVQVFKVASPSVVTVFLVDADKGVDLTQGSGVAYRQGRVVTNCHLLKQRGRIEISYNSRRHAGKLLANDVPRDLCVVSVPSLDGPTARVGNSEGLEIGSPVYAIGSPQGFDLTLSDGLLSGRRVQDGHRLLQISAPISVGSSGGGLFDAKGELVGITTLIYAEAQQINFALPVEYLVELDRAPTLAPIPQNRVSSGISYRAEHAVRSTTDSAER